MKFKINTRRQNEPSSQPPKETISVYPIVNELRNSSRLGALLIALETAFWSKEDFEAAFDARQGTPTKQDLRALQLDCVAVGNDMDKAFTTVREQLPEDQRDDLPDPAVSK